MELCRISIFARAQNEKQICFIYVCCCCCCCIWNIIITINMYYFGWNCFCTKKAKIDQKWGRTRDGCYYTLKCSHSGPEIEIRPKPERRQPPKPRLSNSYSGPNLGFSVGIWGKWRRISDLFSGCFGLWTSPRANFVRDSRRSLTCGKMIFRIQKITEENFS